MACPAMGALVTVTCPSYRTINRTIFSFLPSRDIITQILNLLLGFQLLKVYGKRVETHIRT